MGKTLQQCEENVLDTVTLLDNLGFTVHDKKSVFVPSKEVVFVGFVLNSETMTIRITPEKRDKIVSLCLDIIIKHTVTIQTFAKLIGKLVATEPGVEFTKSSSETGGRRDNSSGNCANMANAELVVSTTSVDSGSALHTANTKAHTVFASKPRENSPIEKNDTGCFSLIREALMRKNIQGKAANIIIESWRGSTQKQYNTYIQKWLEFLSRQKADTFNPTKEEVINFLSELYDKGIGYSGIGTARSALSIFISVCSRKSMDISNNFFIKKFMKGVFNKRPALPQYNSSWDPEIVLNY